MKSMLAVVVVVTAASLGSGVQAANPLPPQRVEAIQKLLECRSITEAGARLACFDKGTLALDTALERRDIVVADRAQIRTARRSLFGLTLPSFNLFGKGDNEDDKEDQASFAQLESTIRSAYERGDSKWVLVLEDGAKWLQTDTRDFVVDPRAGMKIVIKRAAMGSYLANVAGQTAIRVHREN